jgi:hypothetical protein
MPQKQKARHCALLAKRCLQLDPNMNIKVGMKLYDKTRRWVCIVDRIEVHNRLKCEWYVVNYLNGLTRNVFDYELAQQTNNTRSRKRAKPRIRRA